MDFVQYTAKAYDLLLMLVSLILGAFVGPFRFAALLILVLLAGTGLLLWLRKRGRRS